MIAIIDYGMGNLASVQNALLKLGYDTITTDKADEIEKARGVILPGVGAFEDAARNLRYLGLHKTIFRTIDRGLPFLGICLGLQLLFSESDENGLHKGLDIIPGRVERFQLPAQYKIPHMGWNQVKSVPGSRLFNGISRDSHFYFVHSYHVAPRDGASCTAGICNYGYDFVCAVEVENLMGTQFHPEKSSSKGMQILKKFGELTR